VEANCTAPAHPASSRFYGVFPCIRLGQAARI
jgi:hypothetical protein